ncbi:MAG: NAD(P)H-hydrate dehydratase [Verrucomicrobia bacterium]|nr:NAD(P)H-hydrate dehydratase [Verrucomicrobiota bacterium]
MGLPVITIAQMREWEQASWSAGITEAEVIERVGACVASRAVELSTGSKPILVLAGKGHNGDDASATADFLSTRGHPSVSVSVEDPVKALAELPLQNIQEHSLIVDGLFGIGINRPLNEGWQRLIGAINDSNVPVLSVDTPSGLNADSGEVQGAAIRASVTLTVGAPKRGLLLSQAAEWVGRLEVASDVGLVHCPFRTNLTWIESRDFEQFPPTRLVSTHKGTYGHVAIFAGSLGYHGAAVLAAGGALRAQPGLVSLFTPESVYLPVASQLQAAMVHPWRGDEEVPRSSSAIVCGPGMAAIGFPAVLKEKLRELWMTSSLPVLADASALDWLPAAEIRSTAVRVITPHPGEAARLLQQTTETVQSDRVQALRNLSARYGHCWVVLKGHHTLIGRSEGEVFVNSSGNPYLAQGGSGDVLAGFIGGLIAQPRLQKDPARTIGYAVWQHGAAADGLSRTKRNWTVAELSQSLNS